MISDWLEFLIDHQQASWQVALYSSHPSQLSPMAQEANTATGNIDSETRGKRNYSEDDLTKIASYLRGGKGLTLRSAVQLGKRVEYFKGQKLVKYLMDDEAGSVETHVVSATG